MNGHNGRSPCWQTAPDQFANNLQIACRDYYDRAAITASVAYMRQHGKKSARASKGLLKRTPTQRRRHER